MKTPRTFSGRVLVTAAVAALVLSGCRGGAPGGGGGEGGGAANVPGITDDTIVIGATAPLSGPVSANGTAAVGGYKAYFKQVNAEGGVKMSDGKTRKIKYVYYDDGYDPSRAVQNYKRLVNQDHVFAIAPTFGTPTSLAVMKLANKDKVPQIFVHTGDGTFSEDQKTNPWTIGWAPTYEDEGKAYGEFLSNKGKKVTVAVLRQNDDLGAAYLRGFKKAIEGSKVKIVAQQTYEPTDPTVESQINNLAKSHADVLYLAVSVTKLAANALVHAREIGWHPTPLIIRLSSSIYQVIKPAGMMKADNLYSAAFTKLADNPKAQSDPEVKKFAASMKKYAPDANPKVPNAAWAYAAASTLVDALKQMKPISRKGLMDAVHQIHPQNIPMVLPGVTYDPSSRTEPPVHGLRLMRFKNGQWNLLQTQQ
ncbi:MAG: ABC transporter substrate-binding protein [Streptosporangiaceae bacterium]